MKWQRHEGAMVVLDPAVWEDGAPAVAAPTQLDFRHGLDVAGASGGAQVSVDESELAVPQANVTGLAAALAALQPLDSDLTALAALTTTAFGRGLLELANAAAGRSALGLGTAATSNAGDFDAAGAAAAAQAASQPLDSDLTAIAALATTAYGRSLLAAADAAALRALAAAAPLASPVFTGDPQAPTPGTTDADTTVATTAMVRAQLTRRELARQGQGYVAVPLYPYAVLAAANIQTSGTAVFSLVGLHKGDVITNLGSNVTVNGATLTWVELALIDLAGTVLATTGDLSGGTSYTAGGVPRLQVNPVKVAGVNTPFTITADAAYYIGALFITAAGTMPTLRSSGGLANPLEPVAHTFEYAQQAGFTSGGSGFASQAISPVAASRCYWLVAT